MIANNLKVENAAAQPGTDAWHALSSSEVGTRLHTNLSTGLNAVEAGRRLEQFGRNQLQEEEKEPFWKEFLEELSEPLILLLVFTGILYILLGEVEDGLVIFAVILALNTIEVVNEQRARSAIASLQKLAEPAAWVIRDGHTQEIPVDQVVPGDLILLEAGRRVPADARLVESYGLAVDESTLTGESLPVEKDSSQPVGAAAPLAERTSMVFSGTLVTRGRGRAVVVQTGMATELGRIAGLAREVEPPPTPLRKAMDEVSRTLVWLALGFSIGIPLLGVLVARQPFQSMLLTGLSLAFATIPEEMPIILTMVLSLGGYRLSRQKAIVKNLEAVETLGAVTVIATDKTGTLTENRMQVGQLFPVANQPRILEAGLLCSGVSSGGVDLSEAGGDPLEIALRRAAFESGIDAAGLLRRYPRVTEYSFDNARQRMSVVTRANDPVTTSYQVWVKGAPESILGISSRQLESSGTLPKEEPLDPASRQALLDQAAGLAGQGLRVIALAWKELPSVPTGQEQAESDLTFLGLVGLLDPPRGEVHDAIRSMHAAGIRTLMITGDHPLTARAIAQAVGLDGDRRVVTGTELDQLSDEQLGQVVNETSLFARAAPRHKLRIVQVLQARGERVAVTGDGVNDAPALTMADIGVAMGETGSDVAREAGDMVLADDNYATIANAIREGRLLFANLQKGVRYYLAIKVALVLVMLVPVLLQVPAPFAPVQIILMELFMDLAAAAAFVAEPAEGDLMCLPPRNPKAPFLDRAMVSSILSGAAGLFAAVTTIYLWTWYSGASLEVAQTSAFAAWMIGHVLLAFNLRSERQPVLQLGLSSNRVMLAWGVVVAAFLAVVELIPALHPLMKITALPARQWGIIILAAFLGAFWIEGRKLLTYRR